MVKIIGLLFVVSVIALSSLYLYNLNRTKESQQNVSSTPFDLNVQLKWKHQSQFAGNYVAIDQNFYQDENLNVKLLERTEPAQSIAEKLVSGQVDVGILSSWELISEVEQGKKLVAIAAIYQISPAAAFALKSSNIIDPTNFRNKKLGVFPGNIYSQKFYQLLMSNSEVSSNSASFVDVGNDTAEDLTSKKVDVITGYRTLDAFMLSKKNLDFVSIHPEDYGVELYDDVYVVTETFLNEHPEEISRFLKATQKGWTTALENPSSAVQITKKYATNFNNDELLSFIIEQSKPLIIPTDGKKIGSMSYLQWKKIQNYLVYTDLIKSDIEIERIFTNRFVQ